MAQEKHKNLILMKDYGSRKISMLKVHILATYDESNTSTSGTVEFFETAPVQGDLKLHASYSGMGKVVSALLKY